jgi:hypothetical protein
MQRQTREVVAGATTARGAILKRAERAERTRSIRRAAQFLLMHFATRSRDAGNDVGAASVKAR